MDFNKFSLSKVYKLTSPNTEKIYIGSTTERYLSSRLSKHKAHYKLGGRYTANKILECIINYYKIYLEFIKLID